MDNKTVRICSAGDHLSTEQRESEIDRDSGTGGKRHKNAVGYGINHMTNKGIYSMQRNDTFMCACKPVIEENLS